MYDSVSIKPYISSSMSNSQLHGLGSNAHTIYITDENLEEQVLRDNESLAHIALWGDVPLGSTCQGWLCSHG